MPPAAVGLEAASSAAGRLTSEDAAARLVSEPCARSRGRLAFVNPSRSASTGSSAHQFAMTKLLDMQAACLADPCSHMKQGMDISDTVCLTLLADGNQPSL